MSCELRVTSYELKASNQSKVRVQIYELQVQTHNFNNHLTNVYSSKQPQNFLIF